jgi:hypothetical protein
MLKQPKPPGFKDHSYTFDVVVTASEDTVWSWLNDTRTFTDTQVWPYRVEFYSPDAAVIPNGFHEGVLTNHTGPFINFAGELTSVQPHYRDLQYLYGSYAITFRWFRPNRLEFFTKADGDQVTITCTLSTYVKPSMEWMWNTGMKYFWRSFKKWSKKSIERI